MSTSVEIERVSDQADRFRVPGGWIYRTWLLAANRDATIGWKSPVRVQMQAVFVPDLEKGPATAHMVQGISSAATAPGVPSAAPPLVAVPFSGPDPAVWPKDYTRVACDIWVARWGAGSAPGDVIGMNLRQLKRGGAPWDAILRSFQRYVETVEGQYASPAAWRKRWRAYDPEEPEHDHETAKIADSYDRQLRQSARRGAGGLRPVGETLRRLPEHKP
jgi:hypothetical protein